MKRATFLLAFALVASALNGQVRQLQGQQQQGPRPAGRGTITGVVRNGVTGAPIAAAMVTIVDSKLGAVSGADGGYTITDVPAGSVSLRASRVGFEPTTISGVRVAAGTSINKDISLSVGALILGSTEMVRGKAAEALYGQRTTNVINVPASTGSRASGGASPDDAYSQFLFAPELVMKNQGQIGLTDGQRMRIIGEMSQAQAKFTEAQWTLSGEEEKLNRLLRIATPDEQAVIAQVDRILSLEQNLKRAQMTLLVRIKNVLTPEQQSALSRLRMDEQSSPTR